MRRDQVLKICLNHRLTADLVVEPKGNDDRAYVWSASDFSEEEMHLEQFAMRFKTADIAANFIAAVRKAQTELAATPSTPGNDGSMMVNAGTPFTKSRLETVTSRTSPRPADQTIASTTSSVYESPSAQNFSFLSPPSFSLGGLLGAQSSPQGMNTSSQRNRIEFHIICLLSL